MIKTEPKFNDCIKCYTTAASKTDFWAHETLSNYHYIIETPENKITIKKSITHWHKAASNMMRFPYFKSDWPLPSFYFWYSTEEIWKQRPKTSLNSCKNEQEDQNQDPSQSSRCKPSAIISTPTSNDRKPQLKKCTHPWMVLL